MRISPTRRSVEVEFFSLDPRDDYKTSEWRFCVMILLPLGKYLWDVVLTQSTTAKCTSQRTTQVSEPVACSDLRATTLVPVMVAHPAYPHPTACLFS
ncbi:hypothetical protein NDN08_006223 [Rhodosorus marinus]|uniref:Uncharacterized protein n=1 Tax=Rhodosorus marinus TaxID=101924 RepID=A0AAV8ULM4_9RHOD|nr:hypothetical protein NDN08_006223 [Rhodosorus marinus]